MLSHFSCVLAFVTLWTVARHAPLSKGFSRQEWSGLLCPPPGNLPDPGTEPTSLEVFKSLALAGGFFTTGATWEALPIKDVLLKRIGGWEKWGVKFF